MNKLSSIIAIAAIALPLAAFTGLANAGQTSIVGGGMNTSSMFSTGFVAISHTGHSFIGANASHGSAVVGAGGSYNSFAQSVHHYEKSWSNSGLSASATTRRTGTSFDGDMSTSAYGNGVSNVTAGMKGRAKARKVGNGTMAVAKMDTGGTAMSLGNVSSFTSAIGGTSAFAWH